jgi:hypothetical protein
MGGRFRKVFKKKGPPAAKVGSGPGELATTPHEFEGKFTGVNIFFLELSRILEATALHGGARPGAALL